MGKRWFTFRKAETAASWIFNEAVWRPDKFNEEGTQVARMWGMQKDPIV